jgi:SAM-dependent methyltransferase
MPFIPLPKNFTDLCTSGQFEPSRSVELGCGDGRFLNILRDSGFTVWGLDRIPPAGGSAADIVADALSPPLAAGSLDLVVASNLVRHLAVRHEGLPFLDTWLGLLQPGGSLYIFEDEPGDSPAGTANFRDLHAFLARLMPVTRGPLLPLDKFRAAVDRSACPACWDYGRVKNEYQLDAGAAMRMLRGQGATPQGEASRLIRAIGRRGLDAGWYWWARAIRP